MASFDGNRLPLVAPKVAQCMYSASIQVIPNNITWEQLYLRNLLIVAGCL